MGKTVRDYSDKKRHIACLVRRLSDLSHHLREISKYLNNSPHDITVGSDTVQLKISNQYTGGTSTQSIPILDWDPAEWGKLVADLNTSNQDLEDLASSLRDIGLASMTDKASSSP